MRVCLLLLLMLFSVTANAHGSSHPSCNGIRWDDNRTGYERCVAQKRANYIRAYNLCTATPGCRAKQIAEQKHRERVVITVALLAITALILLLVL